jgi:hypothetical protein
LIPLFATGVVDPGGKFAAGVIDTSGEFAAGIVDTGGKFATSINNASETGRKIWISWIPVMHLELRLPP